MSSERGLPRQKRMRHDSHFVEELTGQPAPAVGALIEIERIEPGPEPEGAGDVAELVAEIRRTGNVQPLLVRAAGGRYRIVAGERRLRAARAAGLTRVPCVEVDVDARGMLEASLIEELRRDDLGPFAEAAGLQRLCDEFRYTHHELAEKVGKTRTVVTETLSLNRMPEEVRERCRKVGVTSKSMLLQVVRQRDPAAMTGLLERIEREGIGRDEARRLHRAGKGRRGRGFTYRHAAADASYEVRLSFARADVAPREILAAAECALEAVRAEFGAAGAEVGVGTLRRRSAAERRRGGEGAATERA